MVSSQAGPIQTLSILMPVYNEVRTLGTILRAVLDAPLPCARELIVVDDGSTDGSRELLTAFASEHEEVRLIFHPENRGKGAAVRTAIEAMTGDWAIIQDADLEYDPRDYAAMLAPALDGVADAVFGSRFLVGRYSRVMYFWHYFANRLITLMYDAVADVNVTDMETCYKLVRADILKTLRLTSNGFDLEPELAVKLARWGARLYEAPIAYRGRTYLEGKKIGFKDAVRALYAVIWYRFFDSAYCKREEFPVLQAMRKARRFNRWQFGRIAPWIGNDVLEVGCGIGSLTERVLDRRKLVCVDEDAFYCDRLRNAYGHLNNLKVLCADVASDGGVRTLGEQGPFDTVVCVNAIEHVADDQRVLDNLASLVAPGGHLIVLVPNAPSLFGAMDKTLGHHRRYDRESLTGKVAQTGLEVVACEGFNRLGAIGWRIAGWLGTRHPSARHVWAFNKLVPLARLVEEMPFHPHNSLTCVACRRTDR